MNLPETNESYREESYWDERYRREDSYEWLAGYSSLRSPVGRHLTSFPRRGCSILQLGCGNSDLAVGLYRDGWTDITNIDISQVVVDNMRLKWAGTKLKWLKMDMTDMAFEDGSFDVVIEKVNFYT